MNNILFGLLYFLSLLQKFVPHTHARGKIIFDLNCRHLHSLLRAMLFPVIEPTHLKACHLISDRANTMITKKMTALSAERLSDPISVGLPGCPPAHCTC